jgi:hypothetical protein
MFFLLTSRGIARTRARIARYKDRVALLALLLAFPSPAFPQSAFAPGGATVSLAVTGTTGRVQIATSASSQNVRIYNAGTVAVFVVCGDVSSVATVAAGLPIAPGTVEVIGCAQTYVAGISAGTAATVYLTPGNGL